jgi:hypothetical protein
MGCSRVNKLCSIVTDLDLAELAYLKYCHETGKTVQIDLIASY